MPLHEAKLEPQYVMAIQGNVHTSGREATLGCRCFNQKCYSPLSTEASTWIQIPLTSSSMTMFEQFSFHLVVPPSCWICPTRPFSPFMLLRGHALRHGRSMGPCPTRWTCHIATFRASVSLHQVPCISPYPSTLALSCYKGHTF